MIITSSAVKEKLVSSVFTKLVLLLLCFGSCTHAGEEATSLDAAITGRVVSIADGDTFTMLTSGTQQVKVRLYGIDAPEKKQDFGEKAKKKLASLVHQQTVRVEVKGKDRYRRVLGVVYLGNGVCVNEEMMRTGYAWHFRRYDNNPDWHKLEQTAKESKLGLWAHPSPVAPWLFRRSK